MKCITRHGVVGAVIVLLTTASIMLTACGDRSGESLYSITGQVTYNGEGLAGVTVSTGGNSATTDESGNYTILGLSRGNYILTASKEGYTFTDSSATVSGMNLTIQNIAATLISPELADARVGIPDMVYIPGGCFQMGDVSLEEADPVHQVCLSSYLIDVTEVTQIAYQSLMGTNPSNFKGDNNPVENVTWTDANDYCTKVGKRLPTEAEWEYAARSGGKDEKYAGTSDESALGNYGWYKLNAGPTTHPVGTKQPNGFGLYDMSGNVWEWVGDWYAPYTEGTQNDPTGPSTGEDHVIRGGGWNTGDVSALRSTYRTIYSPPITRYVEALALNTDSCPFCDSAFENYDMGFRCARSVVRGP